MKTTPRMPMVVEYVRTPDLIKPVGVRFCCMDMAQHYRRGIIAFGSRPAETAFNKSIDVYVRIEGGAQIVADMREIFSDAPAPKPNTDIALPYCPWCKEPVMTREIELGATHTSFDKDWELYR